jgi:hypothetical protein
MKETLYSSPRVRGKATRAEEAQAGEGTPTLRFSVDVPSPSRFALAPTTSSRPKPSPRKRGEEVFEVVP